MTNSADPRTVLGTAEEANLYFSLTNEGRKQHRLRFRAYFFSIQKPGNSSEENWRLAVAEDRREYNW
jgi:hypothetical protein